MQSASIILCVLIVAFTSFAVCRKAMNDPYKWNWHFKLNREPGSSELLPGTEWQNLGYWKDTKSFPQACKALALKLCEAVKFKDGDRILDVGHGTGESLIMFLTEPTIPRPSKLVGVTSIPSQSHRSKERVLRIQSSNEAARNIEVNFYCGDAICREASLPSHPLHPLNAATFDVVYILDCAYHFVTRSQILAQAYRKLAPGGRIVLGDICFSPMTDGLSTLAVTITKLLGIIPKDNMISTKQYVEELERLGYVDVVLEDITQEVFQGIVKFLADRGGLWYIFASVFGWYQKGAGVYYVIVTARKSA